MSSSDEFQQQQFWEKKDWCWYNPEHVKIYNEFRLKQQIKFGEYLKKIYKIKNDTSSK